MSASRHLPFHNSLPKDSGSVAVMEVGSSDAFVPMTATTVCQFSPLSWDAVQAIYQIAWQRAMASVMPRRSVLDWPFSVN